MIRTQVIAIMATLLYKPPSGILMNDAILRAIQIYDTTIKLASRTGDRKP